MKKPASVANKKTVFIYKSLKNQIKWHSTDPITTSATMTVSSTICMARH
ncbi:hypothetical protein [Pedobacter aquatilis]|nr:hypothetical protein [Pedobacter aquatilis]